MGIGNRFSVGCCCGTPSAPGHNCLGCDVPLTLSCTYRYRAYNTTFPSTCVSGNVGGSITFPMVFNNTAGGWVSDYLLIGDHQYQSCWLTNTNITVGWFTRFALYCVPTFRMYYRPRPTNTEALCFPGPNTGTCLGSTNAYFISLTSCSPFLAGGGVSQGTTYNEDPDHFYEEFTITG